MTDDELMSSLKLDESYQVIRLLADSATGATEIVTQESGGLFVRKKIPSALTSLTVWETVREIDDPRLPQVQTIYELPDQICVVYSYVEGSSIADTVEHQGAMPISTVVRAVNDICHAATLLHEHEIIHRDITPTNIILSADGAHLLDLGIAREHVSEAARDTNTLGTWGFAPPEQYGFAQTDARSDVFSIGRLATFMLTGISPDNSDFNESLAEIETVAPKIGDVLKQACSFEPSARFQTTVELSEALERAAEGIGQAPTTSAVLFPQKSRDAVGLVADPPDETDTVFATVQEPVEDDLPEDSLVAQLVHFFSDTIAEIPLVLTAVRSAPPRRKTLLYIISALVSLFFLGLVVSFFSDSQHYESLGWNIGRALWCVLAFTLLCFYPLEQGILCRFRIGRYAGNNAPVRTLIVRLGVAAIATVLLCVVFVLVCTILFGQSGQLI